MVSRSSAGIAGDDASWSPAISADGRYIAYVSFANNLVPNDSNRCPVAAAYSSGPCPDIFVRDRVAHTTVRVSVSTGGGQADGPSYSPSISGDGRVVAFVTYASNLASRHAEGCPNASSSASDLRPSGCSDVVAHDLRTGASELISRAGTGAALPGWSDYPSVSSDGSRIEFLSWTAPDSSRKVFVRDRRADSTIELPLTGFTTIGPASISANGRFVVFEGSKAHCSGTACTSPPLVYRTDLSSGELTLASRSRTGGEPNGAAQRPSISADGRYVAFESEASDLLAGASCARSYCIDIYRRDLVLGRTVLVSVGLAGLRANGDSSDAMIAGTGSLIAFVSKATNLTPDPDGTATTVFLTDLETGKTVRVG
ncbi:MAG: TolB family protein [Actinomycetota bacterium]